MSLIYRRLIGTYTLFGDCCWRSSGCGQLVLASRSILDVVFFLAGPFLIDNPYLFLASIQRKSYSSLDTTNSELPALDIVIIYVEWKLTIK